MMRPAMLMLTLVVVATAICQRIEAADVAPQGEGTIATLYALDATTSHLSLADGMPGAVVQDHLTFNRDSQLSFDTYAKDCFRVGIQGGDIGAIVDLGDDDALKARYGYKETVGNVQGFTSIHIDGGIAVVVKDYNLRQFQPLREFAELDRKRPDADTARVIVGHMYLVRITRDDATKLYAKLKVLAYVPGQYVTSRWSRL